MASESMNTIMTNNRKLLPKRDRFKNTLGGYSSGKKTEYNLPKATSKQLRDIRKKIQNERKIWWVKVIFLTLVFFTIFMLVLFNNSAFLKENFWY